MKRLLNICLLLTFLVGYLEWGRNHSVFIFYAEVEIFLKVKIDLKSILHPLILMPLLGQLLILYSIEEKRVSKVLSLTGLACLSVLMLLLFIVGLISLNIKIAGSTLPFIMRAIFVLKYNWKQIPNAWSTG